MAYRDLDITDDTGFTKKGWIFELIGWILMGILVVGALLGVFAPGPLSEAETRTPSGDLKVEYQRVIHYQTPMSVSFMLTKKAPYQRRAGLFIEQSYLVRFRIEEMVPEPLNVQYMQQGILFSFPVSADETAVTVNMELEPKKIGIIEGAVGTGNGEKVMLRQFVWF